jgi:hypothetical protein
VGTPHGVLEDEAVGLAGRPDDETVVFRHGGYRVKKCGRTFVLLT